MMVPNFVLAVAASALLAGEEDGGVDVDELGTW
jgi:hypothetical protein